MKRLQPRTASSAPNWWGPDEVIDLFALAIWHDLTAADLKRAIFAYPTGASDIGYIKRCAG